MVRRICIGIFAFAQIAAAGVVDDLVQTGDTADRELQTATAIHSFLEAEKIAPSDPAILLRLSKQYADLMSDKSGAEAKAAGEKSLDYARRALALDAKSARAHLALAIAYGKLTDHVDNRTKIEYSKLIRDEAQKAIALDASDDFAHHVLGRWHHGVATLNPVLRMIARVVYGGLPDASLEEAAKHLRKATELAPQRIIHHYELARVLTELGQTEAARKEWEAVINLPAKDKDDEEAKKAAREALK
jgi:hypothetical protein